MSTIDNTSQAEMQSDCRIPAVMRYACSACPMCSCGRRNAAQEAVAAALEAVRVSGASNTVPLTPLPAGFWGKEDRPMNREEPTMGAYASAAQEAKDRDVRLAGTISERTFTRAEVLAVLKSRKAILAERPHFTEAMRELDALISIFERME